MAALPFLGDPGNEYEALQVQLGSHMNSFPEICNFVAFHLGDLEGKYYSLFLELFPGCSGCQYFPASFIVAARSVEEQQCATPNLFSTIFGRPALDKKAMVRTIGTILSWLKLNQRVNQQDSEAVAQRLELVAVDLNATLREEDVEDLEERVADLEEQCKVVTAAAAENTASNTALTSSSAFEIQEFKGAIGEQCKKVETLVLENQVENCNNHEAMHAELTLLRESVVKNKSFESQAQEASAALEELSVTIKSFKEGAAKNEANSDRALNHAISAAVGIRLLLRTKGDCALVCKNAAKESAASASLAATEAIKAAASAAAVKTAADQSTKAMKGSMCGRKDAIKFANGAEEAAQTAEQNAADASAAASTAEAALLKITQDAKAVAIDKEATRKASEAALKAASDAENHAKAVDASKKRLEEMLFKGKLEAASYQMRSALTNASAAKVQDETADDAIEAAALLKQAANVRVAATALEVKAAEDEVEASSTLLQAFMAAQLVGEETVLAFLKTPEAAAAVTSPAAMAAASAERAGAMIGVELFQTTPTAATVSPGSAGSP
eukprot:CAMPEP_0171748408 /NCGR_PEP_ID=MMETSP0991-20121206/40077_1 /TAXON_ID=483369 /ORGANISM="non described non described, Strain CCMP2098" /LENGTH=557 /DNA_ID=CAMNT_0012348743 /DNA_START=34 /DNA_END=1707 /DNA_ORIENTATION=+